MLLGHLDVRNEWTNATNTKCRRKKKLGRYVYDNGSKREITNDQKFFTLLISSYKYLKTIKRSIVLSFLVAVLLSVG